MTALKKSHSVTVLGRELAVRSSASAERVQEIESAVNSRLQEIDSALRGGDSQLVLILALLNTTEELLDLKRNQQDLTSLEQRFKGVLERLESV